MTVYGVDISRHQGAVNWAAVRADGIGFAVLKATEGTSYDWQAWYAAAIDGARRAGIPVLGSYLFMHDQSGMDQAAYYLARITAYGAGRGAGQELDVETAPGPDYPTAAQTDAAARRIKAEIGGPVGCYTARWYWGGILGNPPMPASVDYVWEARYVYNGAVRPWRDCADEVPASWWTEARCGGRRPTILQINSNAQVDGISGGVDLDVFGGTLDQLRAVMLGTPEVDDVTAAEVWTMKVPVPAVFADRFTQGSYTAAEILYGARVLAEDAVKGVAPLANDETRVIAAVNTVLGQVGASRDTLLAALAAAASPTLTDEQVQRIADQFPHLATKEEIAEAVAVRAWQGPAA